MKTSQEVSDVPYADYFTVEVTHFSNLNSLNGILFLVLRDGIVSGIKSLMYRAFWPLEWVSMHLLFVGVEVDWTHINNR